MPGRVLVFSCHVKNPNLDMQLSVSYQKQAALCTLGEQSFSDDCLAAPTEGAESLSETTDVSVKLRQKALWRNGREREREKQAQSRPWSVWKPMLRDLLQHVTITETQQMHRLNCGSGGGVFLLSLLYAYSTYADVSLPLCKSSICPSNLFLFPFRSKPQHYKTYLMFKNEMKIQNC